MIRRAIHGRNRRVVPERFRLMSLPWVWMVDARRVPVTNSPINGDMLTWGLTNLQPIVGGQSDPIGGNAAFLLTDTLDGLPVSHAAQTASTIQANHPFDVSFSAKAGTLGWIRFATGSNSFYFDAATGTLGTTNNCTVAITPQSGGWYGLVAHCTAAAGGLVNVGPTTGNGVVNYTGTGTGTILLYAPTSYQPLVAAWPDLVAGNDAAQAAASARPLWLPGAFNGRPTVSADGVDDYLRTVGFGLAQPYEVWLVKRWNMAAGTLERTWDGVGLATNIAYIQREASDVLGFNAGGITANRAFAATAGSEQSIGCAFTGGASETIIGGTALPAGAIGTNSPDGVTLFASRSASVPAQVSLSWAGVASRVLTADERTLLRAYLDQQWGPLV